MNRRKFLQLSTSGSLLLAGFPVFGSQFGSHNGKNTLMLVSEELVVPLKGVWQPTSNSAEWIEIQGDPILQFAELRQRLIADNVIVGVSTWMDYIVMSGLFREHGLKMSMIGEQKVTDQRSNSIKAYHWVVD